ncbi:hypothetical protein MKEN_01395100 [Mycena kentingensis (nom. inval.)]|nr:hypothetical protein MKEN_01395100 [Mycena kentingensis (nom. inval.)]
MRLSPSALVLALAVVAAGARSTTSNSNSNTHPSDIFARKPLDVWAPTVLYPSEGAILTSGESCTLVWNATNPPAHISNGAFVLLRRNGRSYPFVLAKDFDLRAGSVTFPLPEVFSGDDYSFVLFGDSGNFSPLFTICSEWDRYNTRCPVPTGPPAAPSAGMDRVTELVWD